MADKMMRIAGRNKDGIAKPVQTDLSGYIQVKLPMEHKRFNANEPMVGKTSADFAIRDVVSHTYDFPQAIDGVFEQSISLWNNTNQAISVQLHSLFEYDNEGLKPAKALWSSTQQGNIPAGARYTFVPEKGTYESVETNRINYALPELRLPYHTIRLTITSIVVPTTGDIRISNVRRF